jgi:hypothetical protein
MMIEKDGTVWAVDMTYVDLDGNPVKRTKRDYPYSYDFFVKWKKDYNQDISDAVYSDRLWQWDGQKFDTCCMEVWGNNGQTFYGRNPEEIETFLIKYFGKKIKLTAIMEGCNVSSGFPIWTFFYETETMEK